MEFNNIKLSILCDIYADDIFEKEVKLKVRHLKKTNINYENVCAFFEKLEYNKKLIKNYNYIKNLKYYIINHHLDYDILEYLKPKENGERGKETNLKLSCEGCGNCCLGNKNYENNYYCRTCDYYICARCLKKRDDDLRFSLLYCRCGNYQLCRFYPIKLSHHVKKNKRSNDKYKNYCNGGKKEIVDMLINGYDNIFDAKVRHIIIKDKSLTKREKIKLLIIYDKYDCNIKEIVKSGLTDYFDME